MPQVGPRLQSPSPQRLELTGYAWRDGSLQVTILTEQGQREHQETLTRLGHGDLDLRRVLAGPVRPEVLKGIERL